MVDDLSHFILKQETNIDWHDHSIERKCGKIVLVANNKFWFVCTFCEERFQSIIIFRKHIKTIHIEVSNNVQYIKDEHSSDVPLDKWNSDANCNDQIVDAGVSNILISKQNHKKRSGNKSHNEEELDYCSINTMNYSQEKDQCIIKCDSICRSEICEGQNIETYIELTSEIKSNEYKLESEERQCNKEAMDFIQGNEVIEFHEKKVKFKSGSLDQTNKSTRNKTKEFIRTNNNKLTKKDIQKPKPIQDIQYSSEDDTVKNQERNISVSKTTEDIQQNNMRKKKDYSCNFCEHIGRDRKSLEAHMQSHHGTGTRHQCEECGKCFRYGSNLKTHMIIHSGKRPYKCEFCDSGFSHPNNLKLHRYIHTGERPYKCEQCDKGFIANSWLKIHMREHTGETPYVCKFCEKGFASKFSYKKHINSHSGRRPHGCQLCEKSFLHKETLNKHMVCHSLERKFACDICPKKFNHKKNLVQHLKLHSNIKQYNCKICSKEFAQYSGLYSHMKYHKNKK